MYRCDSKYENFSDADNFHQCLCRKNPCSARTHPCVCHCCCTKPTIFRSSYIEAVGNTQTIENGTHIVFDVDPDIVDSVGNAIQIDPSGTIFTIRRPGLYHVEWSINVTSASSHPLLVGLLENGAASSALSHSVSSGNLSSGALITVLPEDIPYTVSLHNFGPSFSIENPVIFQNTSASIRILRFADGAFEN